MLQLITTNLSPDADICVHIKHINYASYGSITVKPIRNDYTTKDTLLYAGRRLFLVF